jgi:hypothetical protein
MTTTQEIWKTGIFFNVITHLEVSYTIILSDLGLDDHYMRLLPDLTHELLHQDST